MRHARMLAAVLCFTTMSVPAICAADHPTPDRIAHADGTTAPIAKQAPDGFGYVYLGTCDKSGWHEQHFVGLPDCARALRGDVSIKAREGMVARASTPSGKVGAHDRLAPEVNRISRGYVVKLMTIEATSIYVDKPQTFWGLVELPNHGKADARPVASDLTAIADNACTTSCARRSRFRMDC